jgi:hypothetical protein
LSVAPTAGDIVMHAAYGSHVSGISLRLESPRLGHARVSDRPPAGDG